MNHLLNVSESETFNSPAFNNTLYQIEGLAASQMPTVPIMGSQTMFAYEVKEACLSEVGRRKDIRNPYLRRYYLE